MMASAPLLADGLDIIHRRLVMTKTPFPGTFYPSRLGILPLSEPSEFVESELFEHACSTPILIDPRQRLKLLAMIVSEAFAAMPQLSTILINICAPDYLAQLPAELLDRRVFLCSHVDSMAALLYRDMAAMTIEQAFRTDGYERGDNGIDLTFRALDAGVCDRFVQGLTDRYRITPEIAGAA
jgi:hypothetical protein